MTGLTEGKKGILKEFARIFILIFSISCVSFLYLLQQVRGRDVSLEVVRLKKKRAEIVKKINQLDYRIERLKTPDRIIPLAERILKMRRAGERK